MIAVIFESQPLPGRRDAYLGAAAALRPQLEALDGFLGIERYESLTNPGKLLALSFFRDEAAVAAWRNLEAHRRIQQASRETIFETYRLCVATVVRDYGMHEREQAPADSGLANGD